VTIDGATVRRHVDALAVEEPMELRVNGDPVSVTMRTPGHDFELALGFCLTEGIVASPAEVAAIRYCSPGAAGAGEYNVVDVRLRRPDPVAPRLRRNLYTASSCGLCGTATIESVRKRVGSVAADPMVVEASALVALPARLRAAQTLFERTGGLHAAAVFDGVGQLRCLREDVGRHNAVDKIVGWAAGHGALPLSGHVLLVSGRVAFEITQKALVAGIPVLAAVSAPSSLAVLLAEQAGMTLVGFLRAQRMNVYAGAGRVVTQAPSAAPGEAVLGASPDQRTTAEASGNER
jgi:FdhD protein